MPEEIKKNGAGTDDVLAKIERLEAVLIETEKARKRSAMIARLSVLVILVAVLAFAWNLWGFYKSFTSKENMENLMQQISAGMKDVLSGPEMKQIQDKIYKETMPKVGNIFAERFRKEIPMLKEKGISFLKRSAKI
nr:hypothetical protein [Victivallales bacterium]